MTKEEAVAAAISALRELLELKEIKAKIEHEVRSTGYAPEHRAQVEDYERRKPLAWHAAEDAIAVLDAAETIY